MRKQDVWLGVGGLVLKEGKVLAVKKSYSKTKGLWTFPGGFVGPNETMDEAVIREIKEETSIDAKILGIVGGRTGVLKTGVSDHLILFYLEYLGGDPKPRLGEIEEAIFLPIEELIKDPNTTEFMANFLKTFQVNRHRLEILPFQTFRDYGYNSYKIFK
ncbi:NUDIX domain-containing protein [Tepidibacillus sp. HK-1]|uniref:NUDIX domain-containing protein n=1 Tax=Tepidibacillus sp. HK-1 TaxID=1883407 RepID=UPI0008539988|nr:NUDIX domain-containing protein [Tepidibacillus sp. HK-1]GBF10325.1 CTP pyrophosphohydrolase [Tepidibacillus sp. HK-1]